MATSKRGGIFGWMHGKCGNFIYTVDKTTGQRTQVIKSLPTNHKVRQATDLQKENFAAISTAAGLYSVFRTELLKHWQYVYQPAIVQKRFMSQALKELKKQFKNDKAYMLYPDESVSRFRAYDSKSLVPAMIYMSWGKLDNKFIYWNETYQQIMFAAPKLGEALKDYLRRIGVNRKDIYTFHVINLIPVIEASSVPDPQTPERINYHGQPYTFTATINKWAWENSNPADEVALNRIFVFDDWPAGTFGQQNIYEPLTLGSFLPQNALFDQDGAGAIAFIRSCENNRLKMNHSKAPLYLMNRQKYGLDWMNMLISWDMYKIMEYK